MKLGEVKPRKSVVIFMDKTWNRNSKRLNLTQRQYDNIIHNKVVDTSEFAGQLVILIAAKWRRESNVSIEKFAPTTFSEVCGP